MEQTTDQINTSETITKDVIQHGSTSIDQSHFKIEKKKKTGAANNWKNENSTRQNQNYKKLLSNNDDELDAKNEEIGVNYAHNYNMSENDSEKQGSSAEKKKKTRTPPKTNGNQRAFSNVKKNNNSQAATNEFNLSTDTLYGLNTNGNTKIGSKKNNLNHLLNFSYESMRDSNENYEYERAYKQFWSNKISKNSYFSKEQFLQANCRFVVQNTGDYSVHMVDPDLMVDWNKIEEIHIDSNDQTCPICLYPPQAGKMTKCGHIYCWPCILHYLSLSDKTWRKCPICYESIYKNDLKSVQQNVYVSDNKIGEIIEFELMFKSKKKLNTIILPSNLYDQFKFDEKAHSRYSFDFFNAEEYTGARQFLKILSKSSKEIQQNIVEREKSQLNKLRENEKDQPEVCFVDQALNFLIERENLLKENTPKKSSRKSSPVKILNENLDKLSINTENEKSGEKNEVSPKSVKKTVLRQSDLNEDEDFVYFYQSNDGRSIYLNALNARMMMYQYDSFINSPKKLIGKIVSSDSHFMSEENRKRFRYLSHLPLHSEFKIVEIVLREPFVNKDTLLVFEDEIMEKKRLRKQKLLREKRMADRWEQSIYDPHYTNKSVMNEPVLSNNSNMVEYTNDFPEASMSPSWSSSGISSGSSGSSGIQAKCIPEQKTSSFAQMTRNPIIGLTQDKVKSGLGSVNAWPSLENQPCLTNPVDNPTQSQITNNWLSTAKLGPTLGRSKKVQAPPSPWGATKNHMADENEEIEETNDMAAPGYKESFFSAIDESLRVIDEKKMNAWESKLLGKEIPVENEPVQKQTMKKKKKRKQLLFTT